MKPIINITHTQTPWAVNCMKGCFYREGRQDHHIGDYGGMSPADREFILRAVNNFYEMLNALQYAREFLPNPKMLDKVIAKAERQIL